MKKLEEAKARATDMLMTLTVLEAAAIDMLETITTERERLRELVRRAQDEA